MGRIFRLLAVAGAIGWAVAWWRRHRRFGTEFVNRVVNPALVQRHLTGSGRSELGSLEHVGRRTGLVRITPVHPEPTADGFRIVVPLGDESQWVRNVLAAGHCRLQLHDMVYELDEPNLVEPTTVDGLPRLLQRLEHLLGFRYLTLRTFRATEGSLDVAPSTEPAPKRRTRRRQPIHLEGTGTVDGDVRAEEPVPAS